MISYSTDKPAFSHRAPYTNILHSWHHIDISQLKQDNRHECISLHKILSMEEYSLSDLTPFETEIAQLLVTTLNLKVEPAEIPPLDPLFGEGLGLDSIDALEIALVIHQYYGYKLRSDDPDNTTIFSSLRSLCEAIQRNRTTT